MAVIRANAVAGKLSADIPIGGTSMQSAGLADLPAISSPDIAKIEAFQRDANGRVTKYEVWHVTAHTAGATTATIAKGKEGTSDQAWNGTTAPDSWVHAPTAADFAPMYLSGATASTRYVGGTTSGSPTTGTFAVGDFVIDQSGTLWICTVAGTPGVWVDTTGTYFRDLFDRADTTNAIGNGWTQQAGTWGISSGNAYCSAGVGGGGCVRDVGIGDNITISVDITLTTGSDAGVWFRQSSSGNAWLLATNPAASLTLYKVVSNSGTSMATAASPAAGTHSYSIILSGNSIIVKDGGTQLISVSDAFNNTATVHGLRSQSDTVSRWDNFKVMRNQ